MSQMIAARPTPEADKPAFVQGDTEDKPIPVPRASRIKDSEAVTNAPAMTAGHDTPDERASFLTGTCEKSSLERATLAMLAMMVLLMNGRTRHFLPEKYWTAVALRYCGMPG